MQLEKLTIVNFRNYSKAEIKFNSDINFIFGLNAQGKTNLLEAIYLLCLGRSFRLATNQEILKTESQFFTVAGCLILENKIKKEVVLQYIKDGKKEISIDHKRLKKHSEVFGNFPIVVMSPDDYKITAGSPSERRRFIDILLSQFSVSYLKYLQEYNRILKQRNKILQTIKQGVRLNETTIEPWTQSLIMVGSKILNDRSRFIQEFLIILESIYRNYTDSNDLLHISMESSVPSNNTKTWEENFYLAIKKVKERERFSGMTLVGPHRDDIIFKINGKDLRKYGSRGEHKSVLISLKLAEFKFLKQKKDETPIFLLDDFYSELDDLREEKVFLSLMDLGQIFLTSPKESVIKDHARKFAPMKESSQFYIEAGQIESC